MSVWLTLFVAIFGTIGFLAGFYFVVIALVEGRRAKAKPRLGMAPAKTPGALMFWVNWDTTVFAIQVYRLRIGLANPNGEPKEFTFTVSYDPVQKAPFQQEVELPAELKEVLEKSPYDAILTVDFRTVEELTVPVSYRMKKARAIYQGKATKVPSGLAELPLTQADPATVFSLSYEELVARKKKLRDLEAAAKAKAAKAPPPKPAAATPPAPAAPATPSAATPAAGGTPQTPVTSASASGATAAAKSAPAATATAAAPAVTPKAPTAEVKAAPEKKAEASTPAKAAEPSVAKSAQETPATEAKKPETVPADKAVAPKAEGKSNQELPSLKDLIAQVNARVKEEGTTKPPQSPNK